MTREELNGKKEMILKFLSSKEYKPLSIKEMGAVLQVPAKDKKEFRRSGRAYGCRENSFGFKG